MFIRVGDYTLQSRDIRSIRAGQVLTYGDQWLPIGKEAAEKLSDLLLQLNNKEELQLCGLAHCDLNDSAGTAIS